MSARNIAQAYVDGYYPQTHGLTLSDAVHVLATEYGVHKADLKAAIAQISSDASAPVDGSTTAVVEGEDWIDNEDVQNLVRNFP